MGLGFAVFWVLQRTFQSCGDETAVLVIDYVSDEELLRQRANPRG